jgi:hypothetical protein
VNWSLPSISTKTVRVIKYKGANKTKSEFEHEASVGYAVGFSGIVRDVVQTVPSEERYVDGVRRRDAAPEGYPFIRRVCSGSGPSGTCWQTRLA